VAELKLHSPLQYVKGVGPKKAAALAKYGLETVRDLLHYYPRHYLDRTNVVPIRNVRINDEVTIIGEIRAHGMLHGGKRRYEAILDDGTAAISLMFFGGVQYWQRVFKKGQKYAATGTITYFQGHQMVHPDLERLEEDSDKMVHAGRIIPVYPQTSELSKVGLTSKGIRKITSFIFEHLAEKIADPVPPEAYRPFHLPELHDAIHRIHYPESREQIEVSRRRLAFDELLSLQFLVHKSRLRKDTLIKQHRYGVPGDKLKQFKGRLPFELTAAQKKVIREIFDDLERKRPMSRLMHGDVGCGKTVVAVIVALYAAENGLQTAFMAPTEILAEQHYRNWHQRLKEVGVTTALLTSSLTAAQKKSTANLCAEGDIQILFGTHALIYDYVGFRNLGLVIIDEQHRFGVEQRGKLYAKGDNPDLLVMTATPIPRTLALTVYGDLDISTIDSLPPGRKPIRTAWRTAGSRPRVYEFVREESQKGGQTYIIYPLIERSDQMHLQNVEDAYQELSRGPLAQLRLGLIHGRIKQRERDLVLDRFRKGEIDVLLATTVIEVGIDNPNATVMLIEHAERFGLAQLHQLRGRVGRGERTSTVIAIAHPPISEIARKRLTYFAESTDGFRIAEADLELRGPGEIFGVRQSGMPELRAANFWRDRDLLEATRAMLPQFFTSEKNLDSSYRSLYNYLNETAGRREAKLGGG
jgi:ATP-dependent DNA helicase RecG